MPETGDREAYKGRSGSVCWSQKGVWDNIINLHDKIARPAGEADPDRRIGSGQVLPPCAIRRK